VIYPCPFFEQGYCNFPDKPVPFWFRLVRAVDRRNFLFFKGFIAIVPGVLPVYKRQTFYPRGIVPAMSDRFFVL
jgi:hypothetical protein